MDELMNTVAGKDGVEHFSNAHYELHIRLTSYDLTAAAHFMLDIHKEVKRLSELMQKNGAPLADASSAVALTIIKGSHSTTLR